MQIVRWTIVIGAYLIISVLVWSVVGMNGCRAQEGCLFYVGYFWIALAAALVLLIGGSALYFYGRTRHRLDRSMPIALGALASFCVVLLLFMGWHKPT